MNNTIEELKKIPFEQALAQLEETVGKMESGNLPLDQMISCFELGNALKNVCSQKLNDLEKKIEVLVKEDSQGGQWEDFDADNPRQDAAFNPVAVDAVTRAVETPIANPSASAQRTEPESNDLLF